MVYVPHDSSKFERNDSLEEDDNLIIDTDETLSSVNAKYADYLVRNHLCDVDLVLDDDFVIPAHKIILSSRSQYFENIILEQPDISSIKISNIDIDTMNFILKFIYTGEVHLGMHEAQNIWMAAVQLNLKYLSALCNEIIRNSMNFDNCVNILLLSNRVRAKAMFQFALNMIEVNISEIAIRGEISKIPLHIIKTISSSHILHATEDDILQALLKWYEGNSKIDKEVAESIFNNVNYEGVTEEVLSSVKLNKLFSDLKIPQLESGLAGQQLQFSKPRFPNSYICLFNNDDGNVFFFDLIARQWHSTANVIIWTYEFPLINLQDTLFGQCVTYHDGVIMVTGSRMNNRATPWMYIIEQKTWIKGPNLNHPRCYHSAIGFEDYVYVIGGIAADNKSVEKLKITSSHPEKTSWKTASSLINSRYSHGTSVLQFGSKKRIFVFGGCHLKENIKSTEMYLEDLDTWKSLSDMIKPGRDMSHGVSNNNLYACKVDAGSNYSEMYDPSTNQWTLLSEVSFVPIRGELLEFNGNLFGVSRMDDSQFANIVKYSIAENKWTILNEPGPVLPCEAQQLTLNF